MLCIVLNDLYQSPKQNKAARTPLYSSNRTEAHTNANIL